MLTTPINYVIKWPVIVDDRKLFAQLTEINIKDDRRYFKIIFSDGFCDEYYLDFNSKTERWIGNDKTKPDYPESIKNDLKAIRIAVPDNKCVCYPATINHFEKNVWIVEEWEANDLNKYLIIFDGMYRLNITETKNGWVIVFRNSSNPEDEIILPDIKKFLGIKTCSVLK